MLVRATEASAKLRVKIKDLGRIATPGEEFEVSESRYEVLAGKNKYKAVFVVPVVVEKEEVAFVEEPEVVEQVVEEQPEVVEEPVVEEVVQEKPKRGRKKKES